MTSSLSPVITFDAATIGAEDSLACCDIVTATWPREGVSAQSSAADRQQRQSRGEFTPGDSLMHVVRDLASGTVVAHARCFSRRITVAGEPFTILALGAVCTRPEYRKHGLGSAVVKACFARVDAGEMPWCLFQTSQKNRPFYEHLGAARLSNRFVNSLSDKPDANPFWDELAMAYPASRSFPAGIVDLLGPGY